MKYYSVVKVNIITEEETNYGTICEQDMKLIVRGYHKNEGFGFYEKKNINYMYFVTEQ